MSSRQASRRSGPCDTYYDERAQQPRKFADDGIVAVRRQYWDQVNRNTSSSAHNNRPPGKAPDGQRGRSTAPRPRLVQPTDLRLSGGPDSNGGEDSRVAEWVKTQEISEHVALPLSLFQAMMCRIIESEEATEQLRDVTIMCIRETYPLWKGPGGIQNDPPMDLGGAGFLDKKDLVDRRDEISIQASIGSLRRDVISRRSLDRSHGRARHCTEDASVPVPLQQPRAPDSAAGSFRSIASQPSTRKSSQSPDVQMRGSSPTAGNNVLNGRQTDPISWFEHSSSQGSPDRPVSGVSYELKDQGVGAWQRWQGPGPVMDEAENGADAAQRPAVGTISVEAFERPRHAESISKSEKTSQASRVVAGFRNGVGRFLTKHRSSRNSLRHGAESERAPVILPHDDVNAYFELSDNASALYRTPNLEPRSAMPERGRRVPTTRRSAPLLRM